MNQDCYSDQAAVPMINALDNCRAELEKLKAGAKEIAAFVSFIHDQSGDDETGWHGSIMIGNRFRDEVSKCMKTARELGLLEEEK